MHRMLYLLFLCLFIKTQIGFVSAAEGSGIKGEKTPPESTRQELQRKKAVFDYWAARENAGRGEFSQGHGEEQLLPDIKGHIQDYSAQLYDEASKGFTCPSIKKIEELLARGPGKYEFDHNGVKFIIYIPKIANSHLPQPIPITFSSVTYQGPIVYTPTLQEPPLISCHYSVGIDDKDPLKAIVAEGQFDTHKCTFQGGKPGKGWNSYHEMEIDKYTADNPEDIRILCE